MRGKSLPDRGDGLGTCPRAVRVGRAQSTTVCMHRVGSRCQDQAQEWGEAGVPDVCQGPWPLLLRSSCWGCDREAAGPPWRLLSTLQGVVSSWDLSAAGKAGRVQELWGQV